MNFILFSTVVCIAAAVGGQAASTMATAKTISTGPTGQAASTMATAKTISTGPTVSDVTVGPTTIPPVTSTNMDTTSFEPASFEPFSSVEPFSTGSTMTPNTGSSAPPSVSTGSTSIGTGTHTTPQVVPTSAPKKSGFDGASFGGGIGLGLGVGIICLVVYKLYSSKKADNYNKI